MAVQIDQAAQNLPGPPLQDLWVNMLVLFPVPVPQAHASVPERPREVLAERRGKACWETYCRSVPDVKSSVMKLTVMVLLSSQES